MADLLPGLRPCHDCGRKSTVLIKQLLWTVFPRDGASYAKYEEHEFCPKCFFKEAEYLMEVCHPALDNEE